MINSTLLKAADVGVTALARVHSDPHDMFKEMGVGYYAFNAFISRLSNEFEGDPESLAVQAWLAGFLAERFSRRLAENPDEAQQVITLAECYDLTEDELQQDVLHDLVDYLYDVYDVEMPDKASSSEIANTLLTELRADSEADPETVATLEQVISDE